jgi:hypothetical protein
MSRALEAWRSWPDRTHAAPPHWAVVVVKLCVAGMLLLPVTTAMWLVASALWPDRTGEIAPAAFGVTVALAVAMFAGVTWLTGYYPPVRRR